MILYHIILYLLYYIILYYIILFKLNCITFFDIILYYMHVRIMHTHMYIYICRYTCILHASMYKYA